MPLWQTGAMRTGLLAVFFAAIGTAATAAQAGSPVLLELFTSEGCSSCPPAETLLEKIDHEQPIAGVDAIVLSEHVDYWDGLGWVDPYSSATFTQRQAEYGRLFHLDSIYTPQLVVDGSAEVVGGDARAVFATVARASRYPKIAVRIGTGSRVEADPLPASGPARARVLVAVADDNATTKVLRGENASRTLHHVAVVRSLHEIGSLSRNAGFSKAIEPPREGQRLVVFVQDAASGRVLGAAAIRPR